MFFILPFMLIRWYNQETSTSWRIDAIYIHLLNLYVWFPWIGSHLDMWPPRSEPSVQVCFVPVPCQEKMADWQWCVPTWPFHTRAMMNAVGRQNRTWQQWSDHLVVDSGCIDFDWAPDWKVNAKVGAIYYIYRPAFAEKIRRLSS